MKSQGCGCALLAILAALGSGAGAQFCQPPHSAGYWQWVQRTFTGGGWVNPNGRYGHALVSTGGGPVVLGGDDGCCTCTVGTRDEWIRDQAAWAPRTTNVPPRYWSSVVLDSLRNQLVLFGGFTYQRPLNCAFPNHSFTVHSDTWERSATAPANGWTLMAPANSPPARRLHAMVFDSVRGVTVLFGGEVLNGPIMGDTWEWNGTTWTNRAPNPAPPARYSHAMAYDPVRGRTILFGGTGSAGLLGDTWEWDGTTWARAFPPGSPPARFGHVMAHHPDFRGPGAGEVVLFGGYGGTRLKDTWTWDGTRWCDLALQAGGPPAPTALTPRHYAAMTYDPGIQRLLLFGGDDGAFRSDTWELTAYLPPDFTYLGSGHPTGGLDLRFAGFPVIGTSLNAVLNDSPLRSTGFNLLVVGIPVPVPYPIGPPGVCNTGSTIWVSPLVPLSGVAFPATIRIDIPLAPALIGSVWGVQGAAFEFALSCYRTSDAVKVQLR